MGSCLRPLTIGFSVITEASHQSLWRVYSSRLFSVYTLLIPVSWPCGDNCMIWTRLQGLRGHSSRCCVCANMMNKNTDKPTGIGVTRFRQERAHLVSQLVVVFVICYALFYIVAYYIHIKYFIFLYISYKDRIFYIFIYIIYTSNILYCYIFYKHIKYFMLHILYIKHILLLYILYTC